MSKLSRKSISWLKKGRKTTLTTSLLNKNNQKLTQLKPRKTAQSLPLKCKRIRTITRMEHKIQHKTKNRT